MCYLLIFQKDFIDSVKPIKFLEQNVGSWPFFYTHSKIILCMLKLEKNAYNLTYKEILCI